MTWAEKRRRCDSDPIIQSLPGLLGKGRGARGRRRPTYAPYIAPQLDGRIQSLRCSRNMIADRISFIYEGEVIFCGTPEQIRESKNSIVMQFIHGSTKGPMILDHSEKK